MKAFLSIVFGVVLLCLAAGCEEGGGTVKTIKKAPAIRPEALKSDAGAKAGEIPNSSSAPVKR